MIDPKAAYFWNVLVRVMECSMELDEHGHQFIKVPARSVFDLGSVIGNIVRDESNVKAFSSKEARP